MLQPQIFRRCRKDCECNLTLIAVRFQFCAFFWIGKKTAFDQEGWHRRIIDQIDIICAGFKLPGIFRLHHIDQALLHNRAKCPALFVFWAIKYLSAPVSGAEKFVLMDAQKKCIVARLGKRHSIVQIGIFPLPGGCQPFILGRNVRFTGHHHFKSVDLEQVSQIQCNRQIDLLFDGSIITDRTAVKSSMSCVDNNGRLAFNPLIRGNRCNRLIRITGKKGGCNPQ